MRRRGGYPAHQSVRKCNWLQSCDLNLCPFAARYTRSPIPLGNQEAEPFTAETTAKMRGDFRWIRVIPSRNSGSKWMI